MGKPFSSELQKLNATYQWTAEQALEDIVNVIRTSHHLPLLSVGSGGSFSAAEFQATLHRHFFGSIAVPVTPMELASAIPQNGNTAVWFMSASGNNIDIKRAYQHASLLEPRTICAVVGRKGSRLAELHKRYQYTNLIEYDLPAGKDGFLATNSLLSFTTILYRAYCSATDRTAKLPKDINSLLSFCIEGFEDLNTLKAKNKELCSVDRLHIIYSPKLKSAAIDIESKLVEAGLGSVHLADLRNFAHGRHHWFSKNENTSGILCLTTDADADLCRKTLDLLPEAIPKGMIEFKDRGLLELIAGIIFSFYFTSWKGHIRGIDPGKPGVPQYGSKIYRLSTRSGFISSQSKEKAAVRRKTSQIHQFNDAEWLKAYKQFNKNLTNQDIGAIVFDYDGTLVDSRYRRYPPSAELCSELVRLLDLGIKIGFATGRGKSIREALQDSSIIPEKYWSDILVGYYNGSDLSTLDDNNAPNRDTKTCPSLLPIEDLLSQNQLVQSIDPNITPRSKQITVEPNLPVSESFLWESVQDQLSSYPDIDINITRSSHSIDILSKDATKQDVVNKLAMSLDENKVVLTIGDRGKWPGNDSQLLSSTFSLSVDEVSSAIDKCWNLCPAGTRGPQGTLSYLKRIKSEKGKIKFK
ncbi:hypothetical protein [Neptuniibacter pectenicola]|uniref:hypothetical protein n=1 Tax=Neptuniibacter pectenicola TaxID=1806669 RepID=UPI000834F317|nr:hypothetical protein [Neptuniibacter pectenicola]